MEWSDSGSILAVRRHGETSALVEVFTAAHGRHAGILRGGSGRRRAPDLQPGTRVALTWRARLSDHLGVFTVEPERGRAAALMQDRLGLAGLSAICAMAQAALPERAPFADFQARTETLLDLLAMTPAWPLAYLNWELALLDSLGFGLDLRSCAVTGATKGLAYVSPRTGRAVSPAAAAGWETRLLPLPACLRGEGDMSDAEIVQGLDVTGHFLTRAIGEDSAGLPPARTRLVDALARQSAGSKTN